MKKEFQRKYTIRKNRILSEVFDNLKRGGLFKTKMNDVDKLITDMEKFIEEFEESTKKNLNDENYLNNTCNDSSLRALISRIESVVGNSSSIFTRGMRFMGVESCGNFRSTNTNTEDYFKCENRKIKQYKQIHDLCVKIHGILEYNCKVPSSTPGEYLRQENHGNPIKFDNYYAFDLLSTNAQHLMYKHQRKLRNNQAYKDYKEKLKNEKIRKLNQLLETYSETKGTDLYNTYENEENEETKATVSNVDYFYIKDYELVKLGKIQNIETQDIGGGSHYGAGRASTNYIIIFEEDRVVAYNKGDEVIKDIMTFYSKPTQEMNEEETEASVETDITDQTTNPEAVETATNQPGGKRRSRKKRNMKKSKKGKSKNRR